MLFDKKDNKKLRKCEECGSRSEEKFSFCPFCGNNFVDTRKEREEFGLLGRNDFADGEEEISSQNFGMMDKLINSMVNSMMKSLDKQFKDQFRDVERDLGKTEIKTFPNGIRIKVFGPFDAMQQSGMKVRPKKVLKIEKREINETQLKRMGSLPRTKAKTSMKRVGNKVVYELLTPGVISAEDVFVSKLESGYEIKAIGDKKIYVNSVPINLPLKKFSILNNKLLVEFLAENQLPQQEFE
jgi:hypothetical protein